MEVLARSLHSIFSHIRQCSQHDKLLYIVFNRILKQKQSNAYITVRYAVWSQIKAHRQGWFSGVKWVREGKRSVSLPWKVFPLVNFWEQQYLNKSPLFPSPWSPQRCILSPSNTYLECIVHQATGLIYFDTIYCTPKFLCEYTLMYVSTYQYEDEYKPTVTSKSTA